MDYLSLGIQNTGRNERVVQTGLPCCAEVKRRGGGGVFGSSPLSEAWQQPGQGWKMIRETHSSRTDSSNSCQEWRRPESTTVKTGYICNERGVTAIVKNVTILAKNGVCESGACAQTKLRRHGVWGEVAAGGNHQSKPVPYKKKKHIFMLIFVSSVTPRVTLQAPGSQRLLVGR